MNSSPSASAVPAVIVIPARYGSTRFPGKPLLRQTGKFLIEHVVDQACRAKLASAVLVATDDQRIYDAVKSFGGHPVMTSHSHQSGTDRIAEVMRHKEFAHFQVVVNVQGDEPEIEASLIDDLIRVTSEPHIQMATVAAPFEHSKDVENPNQVKVVVDAQHCALYFSRSLIPYDRDRIAAGNPVITTTGVYRKHLGIYAYKRDALLTLSATPMCELERLEKLEQLRALYLGMKIYVADTAKAPPGIDTPDDYAAFIQRHKASVGK